MISDSDVNKIAKLSYLLLDPKESQALGKDLNSILGYIEQLQKIDVSGVEPMSHVHGITNVFRADEVITSMETENALQNAPDRSGRFIRVPIIIDQPLES